MVTLPLGFDIPDGWTPVEPGDSGVVFVAVHPEPGEEFTPNLTVSVRQRPDPASIVDIADEAVERLGRSLAGLDVLSRREVGSGDAPGVTQLLRMRTGEGVELMQTQVHLTVPGPERVVLELVCTASPAAARRLAGSFEQFVGSVHLREGEER